MPFITISRSFLVLVLFLSNLLTGQAYAAPVSISVDEALALFYQRNLDLIAAQYNTGRRRNCLGHTQSDLWLPTFRTQ
jgi:outer membrane protein, heavy metal efflux system